MNFPLWFIYDLLDMGADPNIQGDIEEKETPLMTAVRLQKPEVVRLLLEHDERSGDPEFQSGEGKSAIDIAREVGHPRILDMLLHAVPSRKNQKNRNSQNRKNQNRKNQKTQGGRRRKTKKRRVSSKTHRRR